MAKWLFRQNRKKYFQHKEARKWWIDTVSKCKAVENTMEQMLQIIVLSCMALMTGSGTGTYDIGQDTIFLPGTTYGSSPCLQVYQSPVCASEQLNLPMSESKIP